MTLFLQETISLLFLPIDILRAFIELLKGIYDQTHYHYDAIKDLLFKASIILYKFLGSIPRHFIAHLFHQRYLRKLGFSEQPNLSDTGNLVWDVQLKPYGNNEDSEPLTNVTGILSNSSGNFAHLSISSLALQKMWSVLTKRPGFSFKDSIFVDFGCGTGLAILSASTYPFKSVIGVEMDNTTATLAQKNIDIFKNKSKLLQCKDVKILSQDMSGFEFSSIGRMETIVLYMYEPLWTLAKQDALIIYRRILKKAKESHRKIIVFYYYAGVYSGDAIPVFEELGSKLLFQESYHSLFFGPSEDLYVYDL